MPSMQKRSPIPQSDPISGVVIKHDKIIRIQLGRNILVDVQNKTWRRIYGKRELYSVDDKTLRSLKRQAEEWRKIPEGSIIITGHNDPSV